LQDRSRERHHESLVRSPRLCIVSRERALRWTDLMVALRQTLTPQDELKIIMDRRSSRPSTQASPGPPDRPSIERRRHPYVDVALNVDGFAIVPASASSRSLENRPTAPSPLETALRDDAKVAHAEPSPLVSRSGYLDGSRDAPDRMDALDEANVADTHLQGHPAEPQGQGDRPPRGPNRYLKNPPIQRLFPDESRDKSTDDAGLDSDDGANDAVPLSRFGNRSTHFSDPPTSSRSTPRPRIGEFQYRDDRFDDLEEPRRHRSVLIWLAIGLVAAVAVLALLGMRQPFESFRIRTESPRPLLATRPAADPLLTDQTNESSTGPTDHAFDARTDQRPSLIPSPGTDHGGKIEPEPDSGSRAPAPLPELPPRSRPQPRVEAGAEHRPSTGPPAKLPSRIPSSTREARPDAVSGTFPGLPRVELTRSPDLRSSGAGEVYVVRISNTVGRPLSVAEASLVARTGDGDTVSIPLEPRPEPGEYRATIPHDRAVRDLRVRIVTNETRLEVPVER
jgi:hypothetical protein